MLRFFTYRLPAPKPGSYTVIHECPDCGLFCGLSAPQAGDEQSCPRCTNLLRRARDNPLGKALAYTLAAACFYILAVSTPLLQVSIYGRFRLSELRSGPLMLDDQNFWQVAALVFLTTMLLPLLKIAGQLTVLLSLYLRRQPRWLSSLFAWLQHIGPWTMVEVYLLGFLVAYTRLQAMAHVAIGPAVYGLVGLMLSLVAADAVLDPEAVWERIRHPRSRRLVDPGSRSLIGCDTCHQVSRAHAGENCPRCGEPLHKRKPYSLKRSWALSLAAALLYLPSNMLPIMVITKLGRTQSYTITGGMLELVHAGMLPLAVLVFTASIAIPMFKLISLFFLLTQTARRSRTQLHNRTRLYRVIDFIGRWSMVDIFMVSILVALVHFGQFADIQAAPGAIFFAGVVVLTILAVDSFDPRLMWDVALESVPEPIVTCPHPSTDPAAAFPPGLPESRLA